MAVKVNIKAIKLFKAHLRITTRASVEPHYIPQNTVQQSLRTGWGLSLHFQSRWLCSSLYIFQNMLSGGIVGCRGQGGHACAVESPLYGQLGAHANLPPQTEF